MKRIISIVLCLSMVLTGCNSNTESENSSTISNVIATTETSKTSTVSQKTQTTTTTTSETTPKVFEVPEYEGKDYIVVNNDNPYFTEADIKSSSFEDYSPLDSLGRCGVCVACIGKDIMPTEERGSIGMVKPSGWQLSKYDFVDGKYLYNRCHLIGYQLTGENANERNLITGTRYMNIGRMLDLENKTASYIHKTGNHVMYRVTPIFKDGELVARGVLMEALSVEDNGAGIKFCNYVYNVQPNVSINYADGTNSLISAPATTTTQTVKTTAQATQNTQSSQSASREFILNKNTKKYHETWCSSIKDIKEKNKGEYNGTEEELKSMGYSPCKKCH